MIPKVKDLDRGDWKDISKSYHKKNEEIFLELRAKNINKTLGKAHTSKKGNYTHITALFSTESDGSSVTLPYFTEDENIINFHWSILMNSLLHKLFKDD